MNKCLLFSLDFVLAKREQIFKQGIQSNIKDGEKMQRIYNEQEILLII
jgi:hypothetical protein